MAHTERAEIEEAVGRELGRMGVQGAIVLGGKSIELHPAGGGAPVSIEIDLILNQWPLLPAEMRERKSEEIARRLVGAHRATRPAETRREVGLDASKGRIVGVVAGLFGLLVAIGAARFAIPRLVREEKVEARPTGEGDGARKERLARACDAVRERVYKGSSFGPFATEGWVVELWLAHKKGGSLRESAALTGLASGGKLLPSADERLARVIDGTVEITDGFSADAAQRSPGWTAATVVFREGYARAFLEEEHRPRFVDLAERVALAAGADHGALYARCAHLTTHDIGAWFHGPDTAGAAAVMVYQMGFFAEAKVIDRSALAAIREPGGELDALRKAAGAIEESVPRLVGSLGGGVGGDKVRGTTLVFPLTAAARPVTATRDLARKMGIGVSTAD